MVKFISDCTGFLDAFRDCRTNHSAGSVHVCSKIPCVNCGWYVGVIEVLPFVVFKMAAGDAVG